MLGLGSCLVADGMREEWRDEDEESLFFLWTVVFGDERRRKEEGVVLSEGCNVGLILSCSSPPPSPSPLSLSLSLPACLPLSLLLPLHSGSSSLCNSLSSAGTIEASPQCFRVCSMHLNKIPTRPNVTPLFPSSTASATAAFSAPTGSSPAFSIHSKGRERFWRQC